VDAQTEGFHSRFGDFVKKEVIEEYAKPKIIGNAIEHYLKIARGLPCVSFCASVENAELTAEEYRAAGIRAVSVDGSMEDAERSKRIKGLADGSVEVLTSADLIGEGLDIPGIIVAQFLRPTQSLSLYMQQAGRALRPLPGKDYAIVLDHVGNTLRHGLVDDDRDWSLDGVTKKPRAANDNTPDVKITTCPVCFSIHLPAPECPSCGHQYPDGGGRKEMKQVDGQLVELTAAAKEQLRRAAEIEKQKAKKKRVTEEHQCETLDDLIELGKSRGYQYPRQWAERRWQYIEAARKKRTG
jgi:superfamily II DNA or RNA helicase